MIRKEITCVISGQAGDETREEANLFSRSYKRHLLHAGWQTSPRGMEGRRRHPPGTPNGAAGSSFTPGAASFGQGDFGIRTYSQSDIPTPCFLRPRRPTNSPETTKANRRYWVNRGSGSSIPMLRMEARILFMFCSMKYHFC